MDRAAEPMRFAYADPPYPGLAHLYEEKREVDLGELVAGLVAFDAWALSTSARALPRVCAICVARGLAIRVGAWVRGRAGPSLPSTRVVNVWEPVVFCGGRSDASRRARQDALVFTPRVRLTEAVRVIGAKPAEFIWWVFDVLGARPGDEFVDVFPGSGGFGRAWGRFTEDRLSLEVKVERT
jgi:hypothetical protein